jgi:histidinol-phosphate/aromatic aminotransferase/cobyric acid decarboxylase-like protein
VPEDTILTGGGSSDLIYLALPRWLTEDSRVLLLDPTYGEYAHVLERVIGCGVDRLVLNGGEDYAVNLERLEEALRRNYDLAILVNPNSPTGRHVPTDALRAVLERAPVDTRLWIDETYVDYAGPGQSLEPLAACSENVIVCKSMSKVYALSGLRVAYLCAGPHQLEPLRAWTPPWAVGLPGQVAAVEALGNPGYYAARYRETHVLREELALGLRALGLRVIPGVANFLLCHLPEEVPEAAMVVQGCRREGLFLRDASPMGTAMGRRALRVAVKDAGTNDRMILVLGEVLRRMRPG